MVTTEKKLAPPIPTPTTTTTSHHPNKTTTTSTPTTPTTTIKKSNPTSSSSSNNVQPTNPSTKSPNSVAATQPAKKSNTSTTVHTASTSTSTTAPSSSTKNTRNNSSSSSNDNKNKNPTTTPSSPSLSSPSSSTSSSSPSLSQQTQQQQPQQRRKQLLLSLWELPVPLLLHVLSFLSKQDRCNARLVCKPLELFLRSDPSQITTAKKGSSSSYDIRKILMIIIMKVSGMELHDALQAIGSSNSEFFTECFQKEMDKVVKAYPRTQGVDFTDWTSKLLDGPLRTLTVSLYICYNVTSTITIIGRYWIEHVPQITHLYIYSLLYSC